jgi:DNA-binding NarL/FixJ family response regulator
MGPADKVSSQITHLTNDEDLQQDLWVYYLSGHSPDALATYLEKLNAEKTIEQEIQARLWYVFKNPPSDKFIKLLTQLSEVEQSVACLLALGLTVDQLSKYKGISEIRIRQVISVMRDNDCWEQLYAEEKTDRRRTPRTE